jgi:ribosomal protein S18 acetylase RimI-like enzyme
MLEKIETPPEIRFRRIRPADEPFLHRLYASTRQDELAQVPWSEAEKAQFLEMQFQAQHKYYLEQFTKADLGLILEGDQPIGRLYLDHRDDEIRLIDIALLPEHRGRGLGSRLMRDILAMAKKAGKAVRIHVEQFNPAQRLYQRLGFRKVQDEGPYYFMEWTPGES